MFDITFCPGSDGDNFCVKKETCIRYWSEEIQKEAAHRREKYISFSQPKNVDDCDMYWKKEN